MTDQDRQKKDQTARSDTSLDAIDWLAELGSLKYAYGQSLLSGKLKVEPEDFIVTELMDVQPMGEGEHTWLDITKTRCNTDAVAKALARFAGVAYRDVAYSGMKDFHAVTRQWFSVWRPKGEPLQWADFSLDGVQVNEIVKHTRKIKRGTHRANAFSIRVTSLKWLDSQQDSSLIEQEIEKRLNLIKQSGVPNYFGEQRFGRNANNMRQALDMLSGGKRVKDRNLRGLLLSSARSWLFNMCVSARIGNNTWQQLYANEPANLNGTNSFFASEGSEQEKTRLEALDIHPTAPMWGDGAAIKAEGFPELNAFELTVFKSMQAIANGLVNARVDYQRRPVRSVPAELNWEFERDASNEVHGVVIHFELQSGQFATSVIRELLSDVYI